MLLFGDVLDKQLRDSKGLNAGKIDGVILELRDDAPPRLTHIEIGPITFLRRISHRLAHWYARWDARFGEGRGAPYRVAWTRVVRDDPAFRLDFDAEGTPICGAEHWLRRHVHSRIPGSGV